jgi:hypothetical protein
MKRYSIIILCFILGSLVVYGTLPFKPVAPIDSPADKMPTKGRLYSKDTLFEYHIIPEGMYLLKPSIARYNDDTIYAFYDHRNPATFKSYSAKNSQDTILIEDVFIEQLNLSVIKSQHNNPHVWRFSNCVIGKLQSDNLGANRDTIVDSFIFEDVSMEVSALQNTLFMGAFVLKDTDIRKASFDNVYFQDFRFNRPTTFQMASLLSCKPPIDNAHLVRGRYQYLFHNCVFKNSPQLAFTFYEQLELNDCVFLAKVLFEAPKLKKQELRKMLLQDAELYYKFFDNCEIASLPLKVFRKEIDAITEHTYNQLTTYYKKVKHNEYHRYNFNNSIFTNGVTFRELTCLDCEFNDTEFNGEIDLSDNILFTKTDTTQNIESFKDCSFYGTTLVLDLGEEELIDHLRIRPEYISTISFHLKHGDRDLLSEKTGINQANFNRVRLFFDKTKRIIGQFASMDEYQNNSLIDDALKHLSHEYLLYEIRYHRQNYHWLDWACLAIPEFCVKSGHGGMGRFLVLSGLVILLFSGVYYWKFRVEVVKEQLGQAGRILENPVDLQVRLQEIVADQKGGLSPEQRHSIWYHRLENFGACLICSATMYVNPKFPLRYFSDDKPRLLKALLFVEFNFGLAMIAMAIYYISKQYQFITELIGLAL